MKILKLKINGLPFNNEEIMIDFMPEKKVNIETEDEVFELTKHVQVFNVMSFYGMNATGKTSTLKLIEFAHSLYLEKLTIKELRENIAGLAKNIEIECLIFGDDNLYNVNTKILNDKIMNEVILSVPKKSINSKKILNEIAFLTDLQEVEKKFKSTVNATKFDMESFESFISELEQSETSKKVAELLRNDVYTKKSLLAFAMTNSTSEENDVISTVNRTNFNLFAFPRLKKYPEIVNRIAYLLDNNIEKFTYTNKEDSTEVESPDIEIKFYNQEPLNLKFKHMEEYLSAGTIRGLNLFQDAFYILINGGTFIVDEIDLNINLAIVEQLILLFKNKDINKKESLLIFTTHVPTLIDLLDRDDNIYILRKDDNKMNQKKLSEFKLRYDKVKSNSLIAGEVGTNPNYECYNNLMREVLEYV